MDSPTAAVLIASVQSVAKVYVIGAVGFLCVKFPRKAPILPYKAIAAVARFSFNALLIPLVYSTTATSVSPGSVRDYWFVLVAAVPVLLLSYGAASVLQPCFRLRRRDLAALRISATFPNVVAIPILVFPSLCEYGVVQRGFFGNGDSGNGDGNGNADLFLQCVSVSNAMIFCYFFTWSLAFWCVGYPQLLRAADGDARRGNGTGLGDAPRTGRRSQLTEEDEGGASGSSSSVPRAGSVASSSASVQSGTSLEPHDCESRVCDKGGAAADGSGASDAPSNDSDTKPVASETDETSGPADGANERDDRSQRRRQLLRSIYESVARTVKQVLKTGPFWAMALGIITGFIAPLRNALFAPGGALRFVGSSLESLGQASSPITTMVVAASLVPEPAGGDNGDPRGSLLEESPIMSDPTMGPNQLRRRRRSSMMLATTRRSSMMLATTRRSSAALLRQSSNLLLGRADPELRRQLAWFTLNRLLLAPALVVAVLLGCDCGGLLGGVPALAKVVVIVNSCVPGAFIVVVVLKQKEELAELAEVVARVYLPTYLLSIVTVAGWTALGLWLTLPDADGNAFCDRR